ncbi:MAG: formate dehydrogenase accessory sulfurtransferase FdhD [Phycisphaeraceae bacterium]
MLRWRHGEPPREERDALAVEALLELRIQGRALSVTMRTPGYDPELAAGFLLSEGLIRSKDDMHAIDTCARDVEGNVVNIYLKPHVAVGFASLTRHVFASSSCGLCGKATIDAVHSHFEPVASPLQLPADLLLGLPEKVRAAQATFEQTSGLHAAAVFDERGDLVIVREDVGRHNAADKAIGYALLQGLLPLDHHVLLVSGRASFEILQKALAGRLALVAAVSAPSTRACEFAHGSGQTLVGFLRLSRLNVYSYAHLRPSAGVRRHARLQHQTVRLRL